MTNQQNNNTFHYTFSARQQEEIRQIRQKYEKQEESKLEQLRRLDAGVTRRAMIRALSLGIFGTLIMGSGMSLIMTDLFEILGLEQIPAMIIGICTGLIGIVLAGLAWPVYNRTIARERQKIAPEILQLTDELLK